MGKKPAVKLRIYRGSKMSYDANGNVQNENQLVTLIHNTVEWRNYLKMLVANQFLDVKAEKVIYCDKEKDKDGFFVDKISEVDQEVIDGINDEIKKALTEPERALTPQEKKIAELEAKLDALINGKSEKKPKKEKKSSEKETNPHELSDLRDEYEKLYDKKPFNGWKADKLKEMIAEKK